MPQTHPHAAAAALLHARRSRHPADALALIDDITTVEEAYAIQAFVARGMPDADAGFPRFWKSGGASRSAQATHAPLPAAGVWTSPAVAGAWPFTLRLIEIEIALRLGRDVAPATAATLTHDAAIDLVDAMTVSIEIVDSRWQQGIEAPALLKLADLQSHGALVLGNWVPSAPRDWATQACSVQIGDQEAAFRGTHSMGDPAWVLPAWLRHATRDGAAAPAGTVVTTGTWCGILTAGAGDRVIARFDGIGEAQVQL